MEKSLQAYNSSQKMVLWTERVKACRESGLTAQQWCDENGVSIKTYYYWQRKLYKMAADQEHRFAEITAPVLQSTAVAAVQLGDLRMEVYQGADDATLTALLRAIKSC